MPDNEEPTTRIEEDFFEDKDKKPDEPGLDDVLEAVDKSTSDPMVIVDPDNVPEPPKEAAPGEYLYQELEKAGKIGTAPGQVSPGMHAHNADEISGLDRKHEHDIDDLNGIDNRVLNIVDHDYIKAHIDPLTVQGQSGKLVRETHTHDEKHGSHHGANQKDEMNVGGLRGTLAEPQKPMQHNHPAGSFSLEGFTGVLKTLQHPAKHSHEHIAGRSDELNVSSLKGELADPQKAKQHQHSARDFSLNGFKGELETPQKTKPHGPAHGVGQSDQIDVSALRGELADPQPPKRHKHVKDDFSIDGFPGKLASGQIPEAHAARHRSEGNDPIDVSGLPGVLAHPQTAKTHSQTHSPNGSDTINVSGLSGVLAERQTPKKHAPQHGADDNDAINLTNLDGVPKALTEHQNKSAGVHGCAGKIETFEHKGKPGGYPCLNGEGRVVEWPAMASQTPTRDVIPVADGAGKLDSWVTMNPSMGREIAQNVVESYVKKGGAGDIAVVAADGKSYEGLMPGRVGQVLTVDDEKKPSWANKEDVNAPPWLGCLYAAYGDCNPVNLMASLTCKSVANGPSPARLGKTVRAVLFRPPADIDVHAIYMLGVEESARQYQIGIYRDEEASAPVIVGDVNTSKGLFLINMPKFHLDGGSDYWFCLAGCGIGKKEYLRSMVSPAFAILALRGLGMPAFTEWDIEDEVWGPLPEQQLPIRAMTQSGGTLPLGFLSGG